MKKRWLIAGAVAAVFAVAWALAPVWLTAVGNLLIKAEKPQPSDAIVVLAGDYRGNRLLTACDLLKRDLAPVALISGPMPWYGVNEADAAIAFGAKNGCDASKLKPFYFPALSTVDEADQIAPAVRRLGIRKLMIVTSNYHTARSRRVFGRALRGDPQFIMVAAPDPYFTPDGWWHTREGQKTMFFEMSKTVADWIGL